MEGESRPVPGRGSGALRWLCGSGRATARRRRVLAVGVLPRTTSSWGCGGRGGQVAGRPRSMGPMPESSSAGWPPGDAVRLVSGYGQVDASGEAARRGRPGAVLARPEVCRAAGPGMPGRGYVHVALRPDSLAPAPGRDPLDRRPGTSSAQLARRGAAFPLSSAHRSTRARPLSLLSGCARLLRRDLHHRTGDRGAQRAPGVSRAAWSSTFCSAARASPGPAARSRGRRSTTLDWRRIPSRNAALVPGRSTSRSCARSSIASAAWRDSAAPGHLGGDGLIP